MPAFDPNSASSPDSGIFGLPYSEDQAKLVYLPVPWEPTTSYGGGTSKGPAAILEASRQVDLYDYDVLRPYAAGLFMRPEAPAIVRLNKTACAKAKKVIAAGGPYSKALAAACREVNGLSAELNAWVSAQTSSLLAKGKIPAIVGGDHSAPYGAMKAAAHRHPGLGVLHFDAHHDMRSAYEGFEHSHASIFNNALKDVAGIEKLVQVGIRDFCEDEVRFCREQGKRVKVFYDAELAERKFSGMPFAKTAQDIAAELPPKVWISFDIDGMDPRFCPSTGTPVPGGLDFNEVNAILKAVARSGRTIVGFDLVEVAPGATDWDANVGARLLYKMTAWTLASQGLASPQ